MLSKKPLTSRSMTESDFQQRCRHVTPRPTRIVLCSSHRSRRWSTRLPSGSARTIRSSAHRSPVHLIHLHLLPGFPDQPLCCLQLCCLKFSFRHILSPGAWLFQGQILNAAARSDLGLACKAALRDQQTLIFSTARFRSVRFAILGMPCRHTLPMLAIRPRRDQQLFGPHTQPKADHFSTDPYIFINWAAF
jgi:hypothetical protein